MKKIMVLGSSGMLGHVVFTYLKGLNKYNLMNSSFPQKLNSDSILLNVANSKDVNDMVGELKPDVIINCIGILLKGSKSNPSNAIYLNSYLPHVLAKLQRKNNGKLIHISTDCVFSGAKGGYKEKDFTDARDTYGLSKSLGEVENDMDLTLRTSIIGPELKQQGEGLFHWFMNQNGTVEGFKETIWSGVTTLELAKVISKAIEQELTGLYHVTNNVPISKFNLLRLLKEVFQHNSIEILEKEGKSVNKSFIDTRNELETEIPSYEQMLIQLKAFMDVNSKLYLQYL